MFPDSKVHGANMGPIWGRQDPGGPHVGPMNFATWVVFLFFLIFWNLRISVWTKSIQIIDKIPKGLSHCMVKVYYIL